LLQLAQRLGDADHQRRPGQQQRQRREERQRGLAQGPQEGVVRLRLAHRHAEGAEHLPAAAKVDYRGQSLDYKESTGDIYFAFGLALLVLFLVMAAQFESFVHPAVIMVTVPLALAGGFIGLLVMGMSFNLFSQIGMLMLIGIASKNGILLVEFINQVRDEGVGFEEAIVKASVLRLRPVLMTAVSTMVGAMPLVLMEGPGAASRNVLGVVVLFGVAVATVFTLFLVPAMYRVIARGTGSPEEIARRMQALAAERSQSAPANAAASEAPAG